MNLTIVLITHQMEVVKTICDRVAVIESGDIIEEGPMIDVFTNPQHPTTKEFTKSVINAELPDIVKQMKLSDTYTEGSKLLVRISFIGDSASEPIISGMVKHFDVDVSIISGNTDQLKDVLFGTLLIEISGNRERIKNALEYQGAINGVNVEEQRLAVIQDTLSSIEKLITPIARINKEIDNIESVPNSIAITE